MTASPVATLPSEDLYVLITIHFDADGDLRITGSRYQMNTRNNSALELQCIEDSDCQFGNVRVIKAADLNSPASIQFGSTPIADLLRTPMSCELWSRADDIQQRSRLALRAMRGAITSLQSDLAIKLSKLENAQSMKRIMR